VAVVDNRGVSGFLLPYPLVATNILTSLNILLETSSFDTSRIRMPPKNPAASILVLLPVSLSLLSTMLPTMQLISTLQTEYTQLLQILRMRWSVGRKC
jgi:hypothetical protein